LSLPGRHRREKLSKEEEGQQRELT